MDIGTGAAVRTNEPTPRSGREDWSPKKRNP
jgi:hypothetical protein